VSDQATMKARIASELARTDLTTTIASAITTAIGVYQHERLFFNQSRGDVVFNTVANQFIYTSADDADIARIIKIVYGFAIVGGQPWRLTVRGVQKIEAENLATTPLVGQPQFYGWFAESIFIEPIPSEVFQIRFGCYLRHNAPASDSESGNRWMIEGERLIRSRAKAEIYQHHIKEFEKAAAYFGAAEDALKKLKERTEETTSPEDIVVEAWAPYG